MADFKAIMTLAVAGRSYDDIVAVVGCSRRDVAAAKSGPAKLSPNSNCCFDRLNTPSSAPRPSSGRSRATAWPGPWAG